MNSSSEHKYKLDELMPLFREQLAAGHCIHFSPNGTSMLPMLRQGLDTVTLSPLPGKLRKYDLPLYQRENGQYVLHRIVRTGDTYTCIGDNQFILESGLRHEQMIAVVSAFTRDGKKYDVTDLSYRLYCIFWHYSRPLRCFIRRALGYIRRHLT